MRIARKERTATIDTQLTTVIIAMIAMVVATQPPHIQPCGWPGLNNFPAAQSLITISEQEPSAPLRRLQGVFRIAIVLLARPGLSR